MERRLRGRDLERCRDLDRFRDFERFLDLDRFLDLERFLDLDRRDLPGLDRDRDRRPAGDRPLVAGERERERPRDQERRDRPL